MKRTLVIANMLFASATVWGMVPNDGRCDHQTGNHFNMKNLKEEIENIKEISPAKKSESPLEKKIEKCLKSFELAQSGMKDNNWVQRGIKLLLSKLNPKDISEYIKENFIPSSSKEDRHIIEQSAKKKAKKFFYKVLGSTKLGRDLYKKAEETIDSAECIWYQYPSLDSYATPAGIKCYYRSEDGLILHLVHETAHVLDWFYRVREKLGQTEAANIFRDGCSFETLRGIGIELENPQSEYVSIFFETLLLTDYFKKNIGHNCSQKFRIWDLYDLLIIYDFARELAISYDKSKLDDLSNFTSKTGNLNKIKGVISELKKNDKISAYIDTYEESHKTQGRPLNKAEENMWKDLLHKLEEKKNDENCAKLSQLLRDLENGRSCRDSRLSEKRDIFTFFRNSEKTEKSLPQMNGGSWEQFYNWIKNKAVIKKDEISWKASLQSLKYKGFNSWVQLLSEIGTNESDITDCGIGVQGDEEFFWFQRGSEIEVYTLPQSIKDDLKKIQKLAYRRLQNRMMSNNFRSLLQSLDDAGYTELSQLLRDTKEGRSELISYEQGKKVITSFVFSKDSEKIEIALPELDGVDWEKIDRFMDKKHPDFEMYEMINNRLNRATNVAFGFGNEEHLLGVYNAFEMFKKTDYEQILKDGNSLSIKDVMKELTKSELIWPLKSIKEFSDFLKSEELLSSKVIEGIEKHLIYPLICSLESMNQEQIENLKELERYKPIGITEESAEELLEFLRR